jgi:serine/threonine protein phosphatase PrpC
MLTVAHRVENGGRGEDRLLVEHSGSRTLAVVADGAGGTGGGAAAAAMACSIAAQRLRTGGTGTAEDWVRQSLGFKAFRHRRQWTLIRDIYDIN